jgi:hypothetical protein
MTIHSFHAKNDHHRSFTTWQMLLDGAHTEQDVIHVARDFIASFTPHELELVPEQCRPGKVVDADDVSRLGYDLTVHRGDDAAPAGAVIESFARFFRDATERLAIIARRASTNGERESA